VVDVEDPASAAPGEPTVVVAFGDVAAESVGDLVGVDRDVLGEVDDRGHGHLGAGCEVVQPLLDGFEGPGSLVLDSRHVSVA